MHGPEGCLYLAASLAITPLEESSPSLVHVCVRVGVGMHARAVRQGCIHAYVGWG